MRHAPIDPALFAAHRDRLAALLAKQSMAILHAADILPTSGDGTLRIHPAADLFWLTGIEQEESVLVLFPDAIDPANREIIFVRRPSERLATWEGEKLTQEKAQQVSGIKRVLWLADLPGAMHQLMCEAATVYLDSNEHERAVIDVDSRDLRLARQLMARYPLHRYERLAPLLRGLRAVKDAPEIDLIRQAVEITDAGLRRLLACLRPGVMEHELEAEVGAEFTRRRAKMAYEPIIASGQNACVLHYNDNDRVCEAGGLLLADVGASYANYCADLTRTYPVSGRFTTRQRAVYDAVLRVLRSSIGRATAGTSLRDWKRAAQEEMAGELVALGRNNTSERIRTVTRSGGHGSATLSQRIATCMIHTYI